MTKDEAIKLLLESKDNDIERSLREWEEWDKRYFEAIDMAIEALKQNQWIPCNERLPKVNGLYFVTDHKGDVVRYVFNNNDASIEYWKRCAIAWMPQPKPYKTERSDKE